MSHQGYVESKTVHFDSSFFFCVIDNCSFVILSYLGETPGVCDCST